jgi:hypothetical protein
MFTTTADVKFVRETMQRFDVITTEFHDSVFAFVSTDPEKFRTEFHALLQIVVYNALGIETFDDLNSLAKKRQILIEAENLTFDTVGSFKKQLRLSDMRT